MPTVPDYMVRGSSLPYREQIFPYSSLNLPDKSEFQYFFFIKDEKSSKFDLKIKKYIYIGFSPHGWLYFCEMLLDFG